MAGLYDDHLTDAMGAVSVNDDEIVLDDNIRTQLTEIENNYESIFSWDLQRFTGVNKNLLLNLIDKVRGQKQMTIDMATKVDEFNQARFYLQLVASYELYNKKRYKESYLEIESVVQFLETCKFDESNEQYADAYNHIARASNAYIALTLKIDSEKLLKDVKHVNNFNQAEKSAICAVKASIFMVYPSKGNVIALNFANQARALHPTEPEWIIVWLKAKGRVRRSYESHKMPGDDEIDAAEILCSMKRNPSHLIRASQLYKEAGYINKLKNNHNESTKFFKLSSDVAKISIELVNDDVNQLNSILLTCIECPNECFSTSMIENLVTKLSSVKNSCVDHVLGLYYLKYEKDYVKAKMYFSRGMAAGQFSSSLQLIKVECLLQPVNQFPFVKTLNMMYEVFQNPNRRLIIISQILLYYTIIENNPKQILWYLKLYLDEDIEDTFKKRNLIFTRPLFNTDRYFRPNEFLNELSVNLKKIMNNNDLSKEEKNTFDRFNKILKLNIDDNHFNDNKTFVPKNNDSWRKKRVDLSEKKCNESHQQKNESWRRKRDPKP
ncbi:uncharacterized protein LOC100160247 isoform X2 [Acyrthosiphon pisum]|uniref:Uncharacterized protein n=1 Tax=Acyrthosiphon pisum TaxID=7029 RepID=A0A8R2D2A9_ACYPI|nr:uncharacterized protein LOC100160247 isoform X2 [Acyrthosiphon pisum]XP_029344198.1 uncharacterized protein LOC100160247 isoform X2 [Acyrthosiphon pisum]|eukprot:XP_016657441.1 PREDICTED: uncharacterized protein LOC100166456 [Acyrthosiphon pisum]